MCIIDLEICILQTKKVLLWPKTCVLGVKPLTLRSKNYSINMTPFLQLVADDLSLKFKGDFSRAIIVFPNKRAGLFLNEYLIEKANGAPVWAPRYMTINELFRSLAPDLTVNDTIDSALRIVKLFRELTHRDVTIDWFYGWAERLLADFDDVDKSMADARKLFQNVSDWKAFDDTSFLTEEQVSELRKFFSEFDPERKSELREHYRQLWDVMYEMYARLNADLASRGLAYEGALFRRVVERLQAGEARLRSDIQHYVFVGFNVIDEVEKRLFKFLQHEGKAMFYWDYDEYYTDANDIATYNEAGTFMRENLKMFPGELSHEHYCNLAKPKQIQMISATTEAIQAQYVAPWLKTYSTEDAKRTAVVLCNEGLLLPVLHALPDDVEALNVTKGFPLSHTEVATFAEHQLAEWERRKVARPIKDLINELSEKVHELGVEYVRKEGYSLDKFEDVLQGEGYFKMYTVLNRFAHILEGYDDSEMQSMTLVTLRRLIRAVVRQTSIPFHGEPVEGLQIMGVLESRCLDFEYVLLLSVNDGVLPKKAADNSFIPYLLRKAFHLTTPERRTAVYAYYFYRLIQRASCVTLTYNTSTEGMSTGEMSRFMTQLLVEWPGGVEHYSLNSSQQSVVGTPSAVAKPDDLVARLTKPDSRYPSLSPSALNNYLRCQLLFYYKNVLHIKEPEVKSDQIQANTFGSIFHRAAEIIYKEILDRGGHVEPDYLLALAKDKRALHRYVEQAFKDEEVVYKVLEARVVVLYLSQLLKRDAEIKHFTVLGTERSVACFVDAERDGCKVTFRIGGVIDRLDFLYNSEGKPTVRVLDYKTGASEDEKGKVKSTVAKDVAQLFDPEGDKGYMLQTFLYDKMLRNEARRDETLAAYMKYPVSPALFFIRRASKPGYDPRLTIGNDYVDDLRLYAEEFDEHLHHLLNEILDPNLSFQPTEDSKTECTRCRYKAICHKTSNTLQN